MKLQNNTQLLKQTISLTYLTRQGQAARAAEFIFEGSIKLKLRFELQRWSPRRLWWSSPHSLTSSLTHSLTHHGSTLACICTNTLLHTQAHKTIRSGSNTVTFYSGHADSKYSRGFCCDEWNTRTPIGRLLELRRVMAWVPLYLMILLVCQLDQNNCFW